jgi:hypothetical protein
MKDCFHASDGGATFYTHASHASRVTVLVVTTTDGALATFGEWPVRRVDSLTAVRAGCAGATVVVVEGLDDASPQEALIAVREEAPGTPVIRVGPGDPETFDHVVASDNDAALERVVRVAVRTVEYRRAVDDLYEQCLARATSAGDAQAFYDALERARQGFDAVHRAADETPYGSLLGPHAPEPADVTAFREALDVVDSEG